MTIAALSSQVRRTALIALLWGAFLLLAPLTSLAAGTATLVWNPSSSTNRIVDYAIHYGVSSGVYSNTVSAGTNTTLTISNLVQGATYYFVATAIDTFGLESDYSSEASALIPINIPNRPPTLDPLVNLTFDENVGPQTVNLSGITSGATNEIQALTVTAASGNTGLIPTPTVNYASPNTTGSITLTPALFAHGSATITVTVNDGGASNNLVSRAFDVTVNPVNHAPTLNALADLTINENADYQTVNLAGIGSGAPNEPDTLVVTASSSNPGLIPAPTVNYTSPDATGSLTFIPLVFVHGSAVITVTVNDGGASNNIVTRTFTVTVNPVNQPPTLDALADRTINENSGLQSVPLSGIGRRRCQRNRHAGRHRLFQQPWPDPDADSHLHQPRRHRLHLLHPGHQRLWHRHPHRHRQRWGCQQQHHLPLLHRHRQPGRSRDGSLRLRAQPEPDCLQRQRHPWRIHSQRRQRLRVVHPRAHLGLP